MNPNHPLFFNLNYFFQIQIPCKFLQNLRTFPLFSLANSHLHPPISELRASVANFPPKALEAFWCFLLLKHSRQISGPFRRNNHKMRISKNGRNRTNSWRFCDISPQVVQNCKLGGGVRRPPHPVVPIEPWGGDTSVQWTGQLIICNFILVKFKGIRSNASSINVVCFFFKIAHKISPLWH